ncbi:preprotein translocase subunit SecY [Glutamicibacter soli]|uniref:Protein translocase subunit SecY n=1 Tax=Glutamicibacter soli TaxID=453836 RepID=A0A365YEK7_9MICC|nr:MULTISPECIES: preprotein translocase subunit SecY [Micrococcaceae]ALQ30196.1 preprotein translocase subunit SecY [Arthrobacter sp. YC-RL1]KLI88483.1 preprotein translocase subunit SecY [Arthrobacter sp. YC-RL1]NAZ16552.1 preprotein translocase subunit SecY [Glutamicibacter soli]RBM00463.1 preprotein translocase subunit SecY [Glutamicibacter soli]RKS22310.1 protein translocase subunit secY/sec61 alpha [Arthrobacter sp. AG1021]
MFSAIARVFRTPDLRNKLLFTLGILAIYRVGVFIPTPGIDYSNVQQCLAMGETTGGLYSFVNLFSGGALLQVSIFAMGIMPYITAAIIVQLLRVVIPHFETLHKEGQAGQGKLTQYTRYLTIALALLQGTTLVTLARTGNLFPSCSLPLVPDDSLIVILLMIITLTAGTGLIMWMGELITERGIGNGMSILIFTSIASGFPASMGAILQTQGWLTFVGVIAIGLVIIGLVVFVEQSQRRVPVQYAKRTIGRRTVGGTSTYIPLKLNMANVIPVIFASSILALPQMIVQFNQNPDGTLPDWALWLQTHSSTSSPWYMLVYTLLTIGFTYFYVAITFNPVEVADNMKKYGGFIPGIRAGRPTAEYLQYVISRITFPGSLYLAFVALIPLIAFVLINADQSFPFGGTSIIIMVGVGLETVKQINAQMQQRNYEGLLR